MTADEPPTEDPPASPHDYLRVRPSDDPLPADRITAQFEQLHRSLTGHTIELLVTTTGDEIAYYLGTDAKGLATLRRVARRLLPDGYAIDRAEQEPLAEYAIDTVAELHGIGERRGDWQTRLRPPSISDAPEQHDTARVEAAPGLPLASVVEGLVDADGPAAYQALLEPKPDWTGEAEFRVRQIERNRDTYGQRLFNFLFGSVTDEEDRQERHSPRRSAHRRGDAGSVPGTRIDGILAKSARNSYRVNARLIAGSEATETTVTDLAAAFTAVGGDFYDVRPRVHDDPADDLQEAVRTRQLRERSWGQNVYQKLPLVANRSPRIVADSTTVPHFALFDTTELTDRARRALRTRRSERTGFTPPDEETLAHYDHGLTIGAPQRQDGSTLEVTVALPPSLQPLHAAWFGKTGSGKSTALARAITANHQITDGADIAVLPKGDGMATTLLRAHYAAHGDLENVYYFDCSELVPALSFFDIRPALEAGVPRTTAVQDVTDHYIELVRALTGTEAFDSAIRSPDVIRYLIKALFDPEYGADAFTHRDLQRAVRRFREEQQPPLVSDPDLRELLGSVAANDDRSFDRIMQGVANRIEKVPVDDRLARLFNHLPDGDTPRFDLADILDQNALVIVDTGGLRSESQRGLALVLLSKLWTALRKRATQADDPPLVNLYLEEAADLAVSDLLSELLAQSRSFGLAVTLAMQFPGQLRESNPDAYAELMNNVSTVVTGNVAVDTQLQRRLATDDMPPEAVGNRLRALSRGEWLVSLPAPFDEPEPRPFVVESLDLPKGHPDAAPFSEVRETAFDAERAELSRQAQTRYGLPVESPDTAADTDTEPESTTPTRDVDSALPYTDRLPEPVTYNAATHAIVCEHCNARYEPTVDGIRRGVDCCADVDTLDRDDIPICDVPLTLSERERLDADYTHQQLLFLQAVYAAQQDRFDTLAYELRRDGMDRLRAECGLEQAAVTELIDDGLLRHDTDQPHTLYTVTAAGRGLLQEPHREGDAYGHEAGDMAESSLHTLLVELAAAYIEQEYVSADTPVVDVRRYYEPAARDVRYDAVGLGTDDQILVAAEAERPNNDRFEAVPGDYDKLAATDPDAAIWVTPGQDEAHAVLQALNEPADGTPRVEKSYSESSPPSGWQIDEPGFTDLHTAWMLLRDLDLH